MTMILQLKDPINNANAPLISLYDPIESRAGSIYLWDGARQKDTTALGVGNSLPNLIAGLNSIAAGKQFSQVLKNTSGDTGYVKTEKTNKGGLHFIASQSRASAITGELFTGISANTDLLNFIYNDLMVESNPDLYISIWDKVTLTADKGANTYGPQVVYANGNTNNYAFYMQSRQRSMQQIGGSTVNKTGLLTIDPVSIGKDNYHQINLKGVAGTGILAATPFLIGTGQCSPWNSSQTLNASPSYILYRIYIEDLARSGRTFAQVKAIDDAEFAKAFAAGGRFYGDTHSDPATVLP